MTWTESTSRRSAFDLLGDLRAQRLFAARVDRAFRPDSTAIARVRATVLARVPAGARAPRARTHWPTIRLRPAVPVAFALAIALGVGLATVVGVASGPRSAPRLIGAANRSTADLDRSEARLGDALMAVRSGDTAALAMVLATYRVDLSQVAEDLQRPGADLGATANRLRSQAHALAMMASAMPVEAEAIFQGVSADLDRMIAGLPDASGGGIPTVAPSNPESHPGPGANGNPGGNGDRTPGGGNAAGGHGGPATNGSPATDGHPRPGGHADSHSGATIDAKAH
jgi:hypothetical protein